MIFYTQSLTRLPQALQGQNQNAPGQKPMLNAVETPMIVTGIPFDQPDPAVSQTLKHLALYLGGVRQVSFKR